MGDSVGVIISQLSQDDVKTPVITVTVCNCPSLQCLELPWFGRWRIVLGGSFRSHHRAMSKLLSSQ